ncbi:hypothetical protein Mapa_017552 [Marchantia paleacea]|nr:hypothetical protein Mapa_017552 [Marchantia paleacea]
MLNRLYVISSVLRKEDVDAGLNEIMVRLRRRVDLVEKQAPPVLFQQKKFDETSTEFNVVENELSSLVEKGDCSSYDEKKWAKSKLCLNPEGLDIL